MKTCLLIVLVHTALLSWLVASHEITKVYHLGKYFQNHVFLLDDAVPVDGPVLQKVETLMLVFHVPRRILGLANSTKSSLFVLDVKVSKGL